MTGNLSLFRLLKALRNYDIRVNKKIFQKTTRTSLFWQIGKTVCHDKMTNICRHPRHDNRKKKRFNQILKIFPAFFVYMYPSALVQRPNKNIFKLLENTSLHQWFPLDFNVTLNCLDNYIAPKLKQQRWRPQQFVCPLKPCGRPPKLPSTAVASRPAASLRSSSLAAGFCSQATFSMQVDPGLISIYVE